MPKKKKYEKPPDEKEYHGPYVAVQKVTNRHSKRCSMCGEKPEYMRIIVWSEGSSIHPTTDCYCLFHGVEFIREKVDFLKFILK